MKNNMKDNGIWVLVAALLLTSVVTITSAVIPTLTSPLTNVIGVLSSPVQFISAKITNKVEDIYSYAYLHEQLQKELEAKDRKIAELTKLEREAEDAKRENKELRKALDLVQEKPDPKLVDVVITGRNALTYESTMTLSRGTMNGIKVGDCVVTGTGYVVGVVVQVGLNWSRAITIIDPDISMGAVVYRTGVQGVVKGDLKEMEQGKCKLSYAEEDTSFVPGDEILTSGKNGTYPEGFVIGTVESVESDYDGQRYAVIAPSVNLDDLRMLFVVVDFTKADQPPTPEEIAEATAAAKK